MATSVDDFVDPASIRDELLCSVCTGVFLDPQAFRCGHAFCGPCARAWLKKRSSCPLCRAEVQQSELVGCLALAAECGALRVSCAWRCGWQGRRDERAAHSIACPIGHHIDTTVPLEGPLGLRLEVLGGHVFVARVEEDGPVDRYNRAQEGRGERQVRHNDEVVLVDGARGDAEALLYLAERPGRRSLTFRHPEELTVSVSRQGRGLGIDISWTSRREAVTILGVGRGAVDEHNRSAKSKEKKLLKFDRIIEVNGVSCLGGPDKVIPLLNHAEPCTIRVHRRRSKSLCYV